MLQFQAECRQCGPGAEPSAPAAANDQKRRGRPQVFGSGEDCLLNIRMSRKMIEILDLMVKDTACFSRSELIRRLVTAEAEKRNLWR